MDAEHGQSSSTSRSVGSRREGFVGPSGPKGTSPWMTVEALARSVLDGVCELDGDPDRVRVDLGLIPVFADERPLQGLAGLIDWRRSGRLSTLLRSGFCSGARGEQVLMPGASGLPVERLVLVGLGPRGEFDDAAASQAAQRLVEVAIGLRARRVLVALPSQQIERRLAERLFAALLEAIELAFDRFEQAERELEAGSTEKLEPDEAAAEQIGVAAPLASALSSDDGSATAATATPPMEIASSASATPVEPPASIEAAAEGPSSPAEVEPVEPSARSGFEREATETIAPDPDLPGPDQPALEERGAPSAPDLAPDLGASSGPSGLPEPPERWWVVADERLVARLRRVLSGPPRPAQGLKG